MRIPIGNIDFITGPVRGDRELWCVHEAHLQEQIPGGMRTHQLVPSLPLAQRSFTSPVEAAEAFQGELVTAGLIRYR